MNEQKNGQTDKWKDTGISTDRQSNYYMSVLKVKEYKSAFRKLEKKTTVFKYVSVSEAVS